MNDAHLMKTLEVKYHYLYGSNMCMCVIYCLYIKRREGLHGFSPTVLVKSNPKSPKKNLNTPESFGTTKF